MLMNARRCNGVAVSLCAALFVTSLSTALSATDPGPAARFLSRTGEVTLWFDAATLDEFGLHVLAQTPGASDQIERRFSFPLRDSVPLEIESSEGAFRRVAGGAAQTRGALWLHGPRRSFTIGDLELRVHGDGVWTLTSTLPGPGPDQVMFVLSTVFVDVVAAGQQLRLAGEIEAAPALAAALQVPEATGQPLGRLVLHADLVPKVDSLEPQAVDPLRDVAAVPQTGIAAASAGPDVIVGELYTPSSYGSVGGISAYAIGTISCNVGNQTLNWFASSNLHPVISQNMYRLKNSRFEHIGQAWLKHGFAALALTTCGPCQDPHNSTLLGVGCSDPYSASLNGSQPSLGPKSDINAYTGFFPYPPTLNPSYAQTIGRRLQVRNSDLDPAQNGGGLYFVESQYVTPDDASFGNQNNNASYRRILVNPNGSNWNISTSTTYATQRQQPAIRAWAVNDTGVQEADLQVPGDGLFHLAAKATDLGNGDWHFEYAVQNLNSHRSARSFRVPIDPSMTISNVEFHDVDYHSGERFDGTDWVAVRTDTAMIWSTDEITVNPNANALRWGTIYNFRFDADRPPNDNLVVMDLFRPGTPTSVSTSLVGPLQEPVDCGACFGAAGPRSEGGSVVKSRYLSFSHPGSACGVAIRVSFRDMPPPFDSLNGQSMWVGEPRVHCENPTLSIPSFEAGCGPAPGSLPRTFMAATLQCSPYYAEWSIYGTVFVYDEAIVPRGTYDVQAIVPGCGISAEDDYSSALTIINSAWADMVGSCSVPPCSPPDGVVDVVDITALLNAFAGSPGAPIKPRVDLGPSLPNRVVNVSDVSFGLDAFGGMSYPFSPPAPCGP